MRTNRERERGGGREREREERGDRERERGERREREREERGGERERREREERGDRERDRKEEIERERERREGIERERREGGKKERERERERREEIEREGGRERGYNSYLPTQGKTQTCTVVHCIHEYTQTHSHAAQTTQNKTPNALQTGIEGAIISKSNLVRLGPSKEHLASNFP